MSRMRRFGTVAVAVAMAALLAVPAAADHIGNNKAELTGAGGVGGQSTANYATGADVIYAQARVDDLEPGDYTFRVRHNNGSTFTVCSFTADGSGSEGCAGSIDGVGFHHADIVDAANSVVATGRYARRGNCREPQQGGSQCEAPGVTP